MDIDERLQELESSVNYLLTQVQGKSKLMSLVEVLQKDNEQLSLQRGELVRQNAALNQELSHLKYLNKKLELRLNEDERNLVLAPKLLKISALLNDADFLTDTLFSDFGLIRCLDV